MRRSLPALALVMLGTLGACIPPIVVRDRESACRVAASMVNQPMTSPELIEVSAPFPRANMYARRAYRMRIAALVLTGLGAAGIAGSFVTGFATDTSQNEVRIALYSVVGSTIAMGAGALLLGALTLRSNARAVTELRAATQSECP